MDLKRPAGALAGGMVPPRGRGLLLALVLLAFPPGWLQAEKFLTLEEAQKLMLPEADRFENRTLMFTEAQRRIIEKAADLKVRHRGQRLVLGFREDKLAGVLVVDHVLGKHELIDYAVALDPAGRIRSVEILEYRESHGGEITREAWRRQFAGKKQGDSLKLHDDVYNISGATMSCRHVTEGVRRILATYQEVVRPLLVDAGVLVVAHP